MASLRNSKLISSVGKFERRTVTTVKFKFKFKFTK